MSMASTGDPTDLPQVSGHTPTSIIVPDFQAVKSNGRQTGSFCRDFREFVPENVYFSRSCAHYCTRPSKLLPLARGGQGGRAGCQEDFRATRSVTLFHAVGDGGTSLKSARTKGSARRATAFETVSRPCNAGNSPSTALDAAGKIRR